MSPFDIYIFYVSWSGGGKRRPVLVYMLDAETARIYPITSQYESKSGTIQDRYFKIIDWQRAGLDKQSYIDTGTRLRQPLVVFENATLIGRLTDKDKQRLIRFLSI